jgi:hypothetical protein
MFNLNKKKQESDVDETIYPLLPLGMLWFSQHGGSAGRDKSIKALEYAIMGVFLAAQRDAKVDIPAKISTAWTMGWCFSFVAA